MENIKKKIASLKEENDNKSLIIQKLQKQLNLEHDACNANEEKLRKNQGLLEKAENDLDEAEAALHNYLASVKELQFETDDKQREVKKLKNFETMSTSKLADQSEELIKAKAFAEDADHKYEEIAQHLVLVETELEKAESDLDAHDCKKKELTLELEELHSIVKSYEAMESSFSAKESQASVMIEELENQVDNSHQSLENAEKNRVDLLKKLELIEEEVEKVEEEKSNLAAELERAYAEINDL